MAVNSRAEEESAAGGVLDSIGGLCARATAVALALGLVEASVLRKVMEGSASGIGIATAGLWFPAAFLAVIASSQLRRVLNARAQSQLPAWLFGILIAALGYARFGHAAVFLRAAPAELIGVFTVAWAATMVRFDGFLRRPVAYVGLFLSLLLQVYANRWVEAHRAYAGAMAEKSFVPRIMLRSVLHRVS
ncbi:MAG: hypothetical protein NVS3B20_22450 [Polyangiales bacterium]